MRLSPLVLLVLLLIMEIFFVSSAFSELRDPTMPLGYHSQVSSPETKARSLKLSAIFVKKSGNYAVINDNIVSVGDKIGQYEVLTIMPETVTVKDVRGEVEELMLLKQVQSK